MATTNETMKVIASGIGSNEEPEVIMSGRVITVEVPDELAEVFQGLIGSLAGTPVKPEGHPEEDGVEEPTGAEELALKITTWLAGRASDNLMKIAEGLSTESMLEIVDCLERAEPAAHISMLKAIFLSCDMQKAADELRFLDICSEYEDEAAWYFKDAFLNTEMIDWYSVENLIRQKTGEKNSKQE